MNEEKEQLLKEIAAEEKIISQLPPYSQYSNSTTYAQKRAGHQKARADKLERLVLIEEEERVASVSRNYLELHPYMLEMECPICLETIPITEKHKYYFMSCCGGGYCSSCGDEMLDHKKLKCALCRAEYTGNDKVRADGIKKWAKKGNIEAQSLYATLLNSGMNSAIPINKRQALKWLRASKDSHPCSLFLLAAMHQAGECGLDRSEEKRRSLVKVCAEGGYKDGQEEYAAMCWWGMGGNVDRETALLYATLACRDGVGDPNDIKNNYSKSACLLGWLYKYGEGGVDQSVTLAKHYLQLSAEGGDPMACFQLAELLVHESRTIYDGNIDIPGFSSIPKALYWARKSVAESGLYVKGPGLEHSKEFIRKLEAKAQNCCAECGEDGKLMCCVRCRAAWYCSKECQVKHWNAGHKVDCIKTKKKTRG